MPSDALNILTELPTPRVWSMLVTIFGDLAQDRSDRIDGTLLTNLTNGMGIKAEAVRVALHRLRNDDWITSNKSGRTANHALSERGRRESQAVSKLIYAAPDELPEGWNIAIAASNSAAEKDQMRKAGFVAVAPRLYVGSTLAAAPDEVVLGNGKIGQSWLLKDVVPEEISAQYALLRDVFHRTNAVLDGAEQPAHETAVLRCLIVHNWRRLVLRHPYLPPNVTGTEWAGHQCRAEVTALLARLPRPSLMDLQ